MSSDEEDTSLPSSECAIHDLPLKLYCEDCSSLVCNRCNRQSHDGHDVVLPTTQLRHEALLRREVPSSRDECRELLESLRNAAEAENQRTAQLRAQIEQRKAQLARLRDGSFEGS